MVRLSENRKRCTRVIGREVVCARDIGIEFPIGYTHIIVNVGDSDMVTLMSANEVCDLANPDTFRLKV